MQDDLGASEEKTSGLGTGAPRAKVTTPEPAALATTRPRMFKKETSASPTATFESTCALTAL